MVVDLRWGDLPDIDGNGDGLRGDATEDTARNGAVVEIAPVGHLYILRPDETMICRVEREPARTCKDLDPGVGGTLALHEAAHITGGQPSEAAQRDSDMGEILTDAAPELESLRGRRIDRRRARLIGHPPCETIHETIHPLERVI